MNIEKFFFVIFFIIFKVYYSYADDDSKLNEICNSPSCDLNDFETAYGSQEQKKMELRERYFSEFGFGVMNLVKMDLAPITSLRKIYVKEICLCFARVYFPSANRMDVIKDCYDSSIEVKTNYYYCKEHLFTGWFKTCLESPVVQCKVKNKVFYLAESVKFHWGRRFRNVFLFELDKEESEKIKKSYDGEGEKYVINYPAGSFELVAPAVNLKRCYQ